MSSNYDDGGFNWYAAAGFIGFAVVWYLALTC